MSGFTKDQAEAALSLGWTQEQVLEIHNYIGFTINRTYSWGVLDNNSRIWYRNIPLQVNATRISSSNFDSKATAYTDGSGTVSSKPAGIGVYIEEEYGERICISENIGVGTNNYAELLAIWRTLRQYPNVNKKLQIFSDSEYSIGVLTNDDWKPTANSNIIKWIREDLALRKGVVIEHVDGHSGVVGNECADRLANIGRKVLVQVSDYGR